MAWASKTGGSVVHCCSSNISANENQWVAEDGCSFMGKCWKSTQPPFWQACKVLCPWAHSCKTMVHINIPHCFPSLPLKVNITDQPMCVRLSSAPAAFLCTLGSWTLVSFRREATAPCCTISILLASAKRTHSLIFKLTTNSQVSCTSHSREPVYKLALFPSLSHSPVYDHFPSNLWSITACPVFDNLRWCNQSKCSLVPRPQLSILYWM